MKNVLIFGDSNLWGYIAPPAAFDALLSPFGARLFHASAVCLSPRHSRGGFSDREQTGEKSRNGD